MSEAVQLNEPRANLAERIDQWRRRAGRVNAEAVSQILENADSRSVLCTVFQNATYLAECCLAHPDAVIEALRGEPARVLSEVARDLRALDRASGPATALSRAIRPCKERAIVAIALAELSGKWPIGRVGAALADLGERTLDAGLSWLTRMAVRHGDVGLKDDASAAPLPGLFVLGGGDLSAGEASYCGPLEIAIIFDTKMMNEAGVSAMDRTIQKLAENLKEAFRSTREMPAVFELDLSRFPGMSEPPLALPAERVREWLQGDCLAARAWFARTRIVAGDRVAGAAFLDSVSAPLWNTGLSGAQIRSAVEAMRQTEDCHGLDPIARIAETCRLALGARFEEVRYASSHAVFETAAKIGALDDLTASRLCGDTDFLQAARNRVQLIEGHARNNSLSDTTRAARAMLCGYSNLALFDRVYEGCLAEAEQQWLNIVEPPPMPSAEGLGEVAVTTSVRLEELGFTHGGEISAMVDNWLRGRYGAGDPTTGRRRLSELAPGLLTEFANTQLPDRAIALFDRMLMHVPKTVDPFKFLSAHPSIQSAIVDVFGNASAFGEIVAASAAIVEEIFSERLDAPDDIADWVERYRLPSPKKILSPEFLAEIVMWSKENRARLVFFMFARMIDPERTAQLAAGQAECAIRLIYATLHSELAAQGPEPGRGLAVIALGDFGGRELAPGAPLDLAFVFDPSSDEKTSADAFAYYNQFSSRLAQAIIGEGSGVEGAVYDIDTRKRPGGIGGDIASDLNLYLSFYQNESHPDEHVALTRARVICGPQNLKDRLEAAIGECVTRPRKVERLMIEADKGRTKLMRRNRPSSIWDLDRIRGGLGDLTFIAEIMQVRFGALHPYVLATGTGDALSALARAGCIDPDTATDLAETYLFFSRLRTILQLTSARDLSRERPRQRLQSMIARAAGVSGFGSVEPLIQGHAERVQAHYKRLILGDESASPMENIIAA